MKIVKLCVPICVLLTQIFLFTAPAAAAGEQRLILYCNDGTDTIFTQQSTNMGEFIIPAETPSRDYYDCIGWAARPDAGLAEYRPRQYIRTDAELTELYAVWQPKSTTFILLFDANGGSGAPPKQTASSSSMTCRFVIPRQTPQRAGCTFAGWSSDPDALEPEYAPDETIKVINKQTTLYAVWRQQIISYELSYNANGGSGAPPSQWAYASILGCTFTISPQTPQRAGYLFLGWSRSAGAAQADFQPGQQFSTVEPVNRLYAVWQQLPQYTYSLLYEANGGTGAPAGQSVQTSETSCTFTIAQQIPQRPGWLFLGWSQFADAEQADFQPGQEITVIENCTLYAIWQPQTPLPPPETIYTLAYHANGGTNAPPTQAAYSSASSCNFLISQQQPERDGYTFLGWNTEPDALYAAYQPGGAFSTEQPDNLLYAVWQPDPPARPQIFTLHYHANGGTAAPDSQTQETADSLAVFQISAQLPQRANYRFIGWSRRPDQPYAEYQPGDELQTEQTDLTLYAVWQPQPPPTLYTLVYHANGGDNAPRTQAAYSSASSCTFLISQQQPERDGYTFLGWHIYPDAPFAAYQPGGTLTTASPHTTLYAVWQAQTTDRLYTLIYNANGGQNAPAAQQAYGSGANCIMRLAQDTPQRAGYRFLGWAFEPTADKAQCFPGETIIISRRRLTLYAVWQRTEPDAPSLADLRQLMPNNAITVQCLNYAAGHTSLSCPLLPDSYSCAITPNADGSFTATLTLDPEPYLQFYQNQLNGRHQLTADSQQPKRLKLTYHPEHAAWLLADDYQPLLFYIQCVAPAQPLRNEIAQILGTKSLVTVKCIDSSPIAQEHLAAAYGLLPDGLQIGTVQLTEQHLFTCRLTFRAEPYVNAYQVSYGAHRLAPQAAPVQTVLLIYNQSAGGWQNSGSDLPCFPVIEVEPEPEPIYHYSLRFEANGGSNAPFPQAAAAYDESFVFIIPREQPVRPRDNFLGWAIRADDAEPAYQPGDKVILHHSEPALTLYAVWQFNRPNEPDEPPDVPDQPPEVPETAFCLYYDSNGGSDTPAEQVIYSAAASHIFEVTAERPRRAGYIFAGWALNADAGQGAYQAGDRFKLERAQPVKTLYAVWWEEAPIIEPEPGYTGGEGSDGGEPEQPAAPPTPQLHAAYIQGYPDGTIRPNSYITRAETAALLCRLLPATARLTGEPVYAVAADVQPTAWYYEAMAELRQNGLLKGYADGSLRPSQNITRAELVTLAMRFDRKFNPRQFNPKQAESASPATAAFTDIFGHWAAPAVRQAAALGWLNGYPDGSFAPDQPVTRAETVKLLNKLLKRQADPASPPGQSWPDAPTNAWFYADLKEAGNSHTYTIENDTEIWLAVCPAQPAPNQNPAR